jgi:hypothetical protein
VAEYLFRFQQAALNWPLLDDMDDTQFELPLYPSAPAPFASFRPVSDCAYIHSELRQKGVILSLLWQEYKKQNPYG